MISQTALRHNQALAAAKQSLAKAKQKPIKENWFLAAKAWHAAYSALLQCYVAQRRSSGERLNIAEPEQWPIGASGSRMPEWSESQQKAQTVISQAFD